METTDINVRHYTCRNIDVVAAAGEIDVLNIAEFERVLSEKAGISDHLVVDLRNVDYIDSAGLEQLVSAFAKQDKNHKAYAILVRSASQPDEVIRVVQIHTLAKVTSDPSEVGLEE